MNAEEYHATQQMLVGLASLVGALDLQGFIAAISYVDTMGAILDPTLYRKAADNLQNVRDLAEAALVFQKEVNRQLALAAPPRGSTGPRVP